MFEMKNRVLYSELNAQGRMTLGAVINQFQNCSTFHSESLGLGIEYLKERQRVWILTAWQIHLNRLPGLGEDITVSTWPTAFQGLYGLRNFKIEDSQGEILAWANSVWVFMDLEAGRPVKPDQEELDGYTLEDPLPFEFAPRKVSVPKERTVLETFPVRKYHLDTNYHVNNGQYVQMAAEYIPDDFETGQVRVTYQKSAVFGDVVTPEIYQEAGLCTVVLGDGAGLVYAVVEFTAAK